MNKFKQLRLENNLTQSQMGNMLHLSRQGYANYENEIAEPSIEILIKMAKIFNCSIDYLLGISNFRGLESLKFFKQKQEEIEIVKTYNELSEHNKLLFQTFLKVLSQKKQ